jgi:hypothetical protein
MYNPYLQEQVAHAHYQELLREAEQERLLRQLPRRHSRLVQAMIGQWNAFLMALPWSVKPAELQMRTTTGKL